MIAAKFRAGDELHVAWITALNDGKNVIHIGLWLRQFVAFAKAFFLSNGGSCSIPVVAVGASGVHNFSFLVVSKDKRQKQLKVHIIPCKTTLCN